MTCIAASGINQLCLKFSVLVHLRRLSKIVLDVLTVKKFRSLRQSEQLILSAL